MRISVDVSQILALERVLAAAPVKVTADSRSATVKAVRKAKSHAIANAPRDTGELAGSIYGRSSGFEGRVGSDTRQAFYQEVGTSFHPPQPTFGPAGEVGAEVLGEGLQDAGELW